MDKCNLDNVGLQQQQQQQHDYAMHHILFFLNHC